ncbi:helix-turn-helix domain-containing protein, partial [Nocardia brasiliensis]|uniref:helix-turn-helix domain-containing protein n=1 Tax=Nocardia brasiliensis TaxID=37326 RepID=UPI002458D624
APPPVPPAGAPGASPAAAAGAGGPPPPPPASSPTKDLVLQSILAADNPLSAGEVATAIGISRATAQRYLATLVGTGTLRMSLRYGSTGRPEQEYSATSRS